MFCPNCGANMPDGSVKCSVCDLVFTSDTLEPKEQPVNANKPTDYAEHLGAQAQQVNSQQLNSQAGYNQSSAPVQAQPKKSKASIIVPFAIGGAIIIVALIIIIALLAGGKSDEYYSTDTTQNVEEVTADTTIPETEIIEETIVVNDNDFKPYGYVKYFRVLATNGVYLRARADENSEKVTLAYNLDMVSAMGHSATKPNWIYVRYRGYEGWVNLNYLSSENVANFRITMKDGLNLRSGPSKSYDVVYTNVPYDKVVQFIRYNGKATWAYVSYAGYYGWMDAKYLKGTYADASVYKIEPEILYDCSFDEAYRVTMDESLNLRSNPTTMNSRIYVAIPEDATVYVGGYNDDKSWAYVLYDEYYVGWVDANYIEPFGSSANTVDDTVFEVDRYVANVTMKDGLYLREEPSKDGGKSTVICNIPYGDEVVVTGFNNDKTWAYVEFNQLVGWVSAKNIKKAEPNTTQAEEDTSKPLGEYRVTDEEGLNLRRNPDYGDNIVCEIPYDAIVYVDDIQGEWAHISNYENEKGNIVSGWLNTKRLEYKG